MAQFEFKDNGKYSAKIMNKFKNDFKFIGTINANSLKELKEKAKNHARSWNEHGGRLYLDVINNKTDITFELVINS